MWCEESCTIKLVAFRISSASRGVCCVSYIETYICCGYGKYTPAHREREEVDCEMDR